MFKTHPDEIDNSNNQVTTLKMELMVKLLWRRSILAQVVLLANSNKQLRNNTNLMKMFLKNIREETLPNLFYEASITMTIKTDLESTNIFHEQRSKHPQQMLANWINHDQMGADCENARLTQHSTINQWNQSLNSLKMKNHVLTSADEEDTLEKVNIHSK